MVAVNAVQLSGCVLGGQADHCGWHYVCFHELLALSS